MFCQAVLAHDAGAREAAAMACRSAVESIGYTYLRLRPTASNLWVPRGLKGVRVPLESMGFSDVQRELGKMGILSRDMGVAMNHVKFDGDAAAHISQRMEEEFRAVTAGLPRRPGAPTDPNQIWMQEDDVYRDLNETLLVFKEIISSAKRERDSKPA